MIKKTINQYNKFFFITILSISFYSSQSYQNSDTYTELKIKNSIDYLTDNPELAQAIIYDLLVQLTSKNNSKNIIQYYTEITKKDISQRELNALIQKDDESIKVTLSKNIDSFMQAYMKDSDTIKNDEIDKSKILQTIEKALDCKISDTSDRDVFSIIKKKEQEYKIKKIFPHIQTKEKKEKALYKKVFEYMENNIKSDKQDNFIDNIKDNKKIKEAFSFFDIEPLKKEFENIIEQKLKTLLKERNQELVNQIDTTLLQDLKDKIQNFEERITILESQYNNTKDPISDKQLNFIIKQIQKQNTNNADYTLDSNKINSLTTRIEKLEQTNERLLYITIALAITSIAALYKSFYSSDEN